MHLLRVFGERAAIPLIAAAATAAPNKSSDPPPLPLSVMSAYPAGRATRQCQTSDLAVMYGPAVVVVQRLIRAGVNGRRREADTKQNSWSTPPTHTHTHTHTHTQRERERKSANGEGRDKGDSHDDDKFDEGLTSWLVAVDRTRGNLGVVERRRRKNSVRSSCYALVTRTSLS